MDFISIATLNSLQIIRLWDKNNEKLLLRNWKEVEIMQFTGLYDKNEGEIYEGDMVYRETFSEDDPACGCYGERSEIVFDDGCFKMKHDSNDMDILFEWNNQIKIIGNIHQKPELIT